MVPAMCVLTFVENAIKYSTDFSNDLMIVVSAKVEGDNIKIEIQDNGLGIEAEYMDRVFEMYFRANDHSKGNGLGLYIVKKTVQKLRGRIELESQVGVGTTVRIFLPHKID